MSRCVDDISQRQSIRTIAILTAQLWESSIPVDPLLRWPGYLGRLWQPGHDILFVGSVHSDFVKGGNGDDLTKRRQLVRDLVEANKSWRNNPDPKPSDNRGYLVVTRAAYAQLAPDWARSDIIREVLEKLMPILDPIARFERSAWTNLAHCRARPRKTNEYTLQLRCSSHSGAFPIGELVTTIWPRAILVSVGPVETTYRSRYDWISAAAALQRPDGVSDPIVRSFNGGGKDKDFSRGELPSTWIPQFVADVQGRLETAAFEETEYS